MARERGQAERNDDIMPRHAGDRTAVLARNLGASGVVLLALLGCTGGQPADESAESAAGETVEAPVSPAMLPGTSLAIATGKAWRLPPDFRPPFAQRQELFVPPDRSVAVKTARQVGDTQLVLKGFAEFEGRRVLLEINENVVCLREGQQQHGITVVAIHPPQVTLRHQGREWTETLLRASPSEAK